MLVTQLNISDPHLKTGVRPGEAQSFPKISDVSAWVSSSALILDGCLHLRQTTTVHGNRMSRGVALNNCRSTLQQILHFLSAFLHFLFYYITKVYIFVYFMLNYLFCPFITCNIFPKMPSTLALLCLDRTILTRTTIASASSPTSSRRSSPPRWASPVSSILGPPSVQ